MSARGPGRRPEHKKAVVALVTAGVEMDVLGFGYKKFDEQQRLGVVAAHPRGNHSKENNRRLLSGYGASAG